MLGRANARGLRLVFYDKTMEKDLSHPLVTMNVAKFFIMHGMSGEEKYRKRSNHIPSFRLSKFFVLPSGS